MLSIDLSALSSAFLLGLMGSAHCLGMCGGLVSALGLHSRPRLIVSDQNTSDQSPFIRLLAYNFGRVLSYCIAGLVVGTLGFWLSKQLGSSQILRYLAATMLILMGLYLGQWFNGIAFTEKIGSVLWRLIQPLGKRFMPVRSVKDALFVGMVWGWLPCGLVYSALIWASAEASLLGSALIMLCFGLGTLPSMLATGYFAQQLARVIQNKAFRASTGLLMISFGIWSLPIIQSSLYKAIS